MTAELRLAAQQAAMRYGIDPVIFERRIQQESAFDPTAQSPVGAAGIAQLMPSHWGAVDPWDPEAALDYGARLMRSHLDMFGSYELALAAYNAGPGAVQQYGGVPPFEETQHYVGIITGNQEPFEPGRPRPGGGTGQMAPPKRYTRIDQEIRNHEEIRDSYQHMLNRVVDSIAAGEPLSPELREQFASQGASLAALFGDPGALGDDPSQAGAATIMSALQKGIEFENGEVEKRVGQLYSIDHRYAQADYPEFATEFLPDVADAFGTSATNHQFTTGADGSVFAFNPATQEVTKVGTFPELADQTNLQFQVGSNGSVMAFNPRTGAATNIGTFPDLAEDPTLQFEVGPGGGVTTFNPQTGEVTDAGTFSSLAELPSYQIVTDERTGKAIAINPNDPSDRIDLGQFSFPQVNPMLDFNLRALETVGLFQGLELEQRGQQIEALGQDFANQISLGQMTYQEAQLELNRVTQALEARRQERQDALKFAVTRSSLVERDGETLTRLPFASQLASILGQATGREFSERDFEIPMGEINPEAAGQDVLDASAFESPIPALQQNLQATRDAISSIAGAPLGNQAVTDRAVNDLVEGING